jgi:hypothetical protein
MSRIWNLARRARLVGVTAGGLALLCTGAALAVSVLLPPGGSLPTPSTTAATEPTLSGFVIHDALVPFKITTPDGHVLCSGNLQDRVVRSNKTQRLDFYYRIRDTQGTGAIGRIATLGFGGLPLRVGFRTDGLGTVPPRLAARSAAPGAVVTFTFSDPPVSCAQHQESRFILIRTPATTFTSGGKTEIIATTGPAVSVPTVMP